MRSCGVRRLSVWLSVRPSVCKLFAQIASSTTQMAGSPPNFHRTVPRRACIQDVLKVTAVVKGHVIRALYCLNLGMSYSVIDGLVDDVMCRCNRLGVYFKQTWLICVGLRAMTCMGLRMGVRGLCKSAGSPPNLHTMVF